MFSYWVNGTAATVAAGDASTGDANQRFGLYQRADLNLKPGPNLVGFWIVGGPTSKAAGDYVDFQYLTINYGAEVKVTADPASAAPDKIIAFTASIDSPPKQVRWDWDFGDGTKMQDAGNSQPHSYKDEKTYTVKVTVYDTSGKQPIVVSSGQTTVPISKEPDTLSALQSSKYMFVMIGGFAAQTTVSGQSMEIPTGTLSTQSGPVTWDGLNFNSSFTDSFGGWQVTYSGTAAADGKSLKTLSVTTVVKDAGMTWHWELANVGNPTVGVDPTYGSSWSVALQGQAATATFVSGTLTTPDFKAPIVPSSQLPASVTVAFSEKPWSAGIGH